MMSEDSKSRTLIGKVLDAHGIKGDIYCFVFSGDASWVTKLKEIYLNENKFIINRAKPFKKGFIANLESVLDRNRAEELKGAEVSVASHVFTSQPGEAFYLVELLNYKVKDKILGIVGLVGSFSSNGLQDLLVVANNGKTYEIPFVKEFVTHIDRDNKVIEMSLPEGLLEINERVKDE